ncbi:acetyltransferase-like isoleucine patch superfamily enzyme [Rhodoblastus acidophilus]|uniref:acyltransferase n=1 Tax=Rhodoblastus acidophilus TaxID=1074 RepID=UPI0029CABF27|nr:acyltransferase [Rhodoblastus acidophilus]MCW2285585.1 acetyltransferase-like isoleucine patch superfamily enzyme [Rhodoblastus acidophilus]MCW2334499.1 acetyltransferase-like isoleucine patch superfamily enzyme [Rhodoblastus acidophilus]
MSLNTQIAAERPKPERRNGAPPSPLRRLILALRKAVIAARLGWLRRAGMEIGRDCLISLRARLDPTNPRGIHIGDGVLIAFDAVIFSHDLSRHFHADTHIGDNCFIGARAIVMAGVRIGDNCIVGAGAVVTRDAPAGSVLAGNPARILRSGVVTRKWGILAEAYQEALAREHLGTSP